MFSIIIDQCADNYPSDYNTTAASYCSYYSCQIFAEEGYCDNCPTDPYEISKPDNVWRALTDDYQRHHH